MSTKTRQILLMVLILGVLFLGGGYGGYRFYRSARQARLVKQARTFLVKANEKKALMCLRRALGYNPNDLEACRLMAAIEESVRSPAALLMRSHVVELNPHSLVDRLALAQTAMMFRDYARATNALEGVAAADKQTVAYHNIAGAVASTLNQIPQAEAHFREAARLDPTNPVPQLNLAVICLHSTNTQEAAEARATLGRIATAQPALRCQALRELLRDAITANQTNTALAFSKQLVQQTNSSFGDRLARLDLLKAIQNPEFSPALAAYQREASTNAAEVYELANWELGRTGPTNTLTWLRTLPQTMRTNQSVALLEAQCQSSMQDWKELQASLDKQRWAELEFMRYAFRTRALRGQDLMGAAKAEWELALKAANNHKQALSMLLALAAQWRWQTEAEEILWTIVDRYPDEKQALQALSQSLLAGGRTRPLLKLFSQELKRSPSDPALKNNVAITALLLDAMEFKPHDLAREAYQSAPTNSSFAGTYAFSLYLQAKNAEALKVMQQVNAKDLQRPATAGYYGLILRAAGDRAKAKTYLDLADKAQVLPEEKKLFDRARAGI